MGRLSLKLRAFSAAVLALFIFIPLTGIALERAFNSSLSQSMLQQLRVQSLGLISEFELNSAGDAAVMPEQLYNDQFNIPDSGLYAFIQTQKQHIWHSLSALSWSTHQQFSPPNIGNETFIENLQMDADYFLYAYTAEFETAAGFQPVSFFILQDKQIFNAEKDKFAKTLWYWLGLISVLLLILLLISLNAALWPISRLNSQIQLAESGELNRIDQSYPPELEKLKGSINHLLDTEQQQRTRYKNSLSDLAHSLKTPLAVLAGTPDLPEQAQEPISQIDQQIQRQLKRAVAGTSGAFEQVVPIKPVLDKIFSAMHKVYADKQLLLSGSWPDDRLGFNGDTTDLMEILGNLVDNACKAATSKVAVSGKILANNLILQVSDDGPGIPQNKRTKLLERGARLDSYQEGQGIGMAVVADLVAAYQGQLEIAQSDSGGAKITLTFPRTKSIQQR